MKRVVLWSGVVLVLSIVISGCKKDDPPTTVQQTTSPLTANPPSVTVTAGGSSQDVSISAGTPPYDISRSPSAIATAQLLNRDSLIATLRITGVSIASAATSVTVKDNSASQSKTVTVPISVH